jgi:Transmembrane protein 43
MSDPYTETTRTDWSTRIAASIKGIGAGIILAGLAGYGLFWNEGSAVQTAKSLTEGAGLVVNIDAARVDPANEGKLVHVAGEIKASARPNDAEFGVVVDGLRLVRTAEMYQWREDKKVETGKSVGGSEEAVTAYSYKKVWSPLPISSQEFKIRDGHTNPEMRYSGATFNGGDITLGAFRPGEQVIRMLPDNQDMLVDSSMADALRTRVHGPVQAVDGRFYLGDNPSQPRIGDIRVSYHFAPAGPVSIIGQQSGSDFTLYQTKAGNRILMAKPGTSSAVDMFNDAQRDNVIWTWIVRFFCALIMFIGFKLILDPIAVIADVVPFIGNLMGAGAALVSFIVTAVVAPVVIAVAWLWYRPMVSIIVIAVGAGLALGMRMLAGRRTPTQAVPATA